MNISPITLTGTRAKLVPMSLNHIEDLYEAGSSTEIWKYIPDVMQSLEDMREIVESAVEAQAKGIELCFTIIDQATGKIVGSTRCFDINTSHRRLEIGWTWHSPTVWRTRINTECKYLLLSHCFETLKAIRVCLKTDSRNLRSQKAIERLGAVREGVLRNHMVMPDGHFRDSVYYSIIDSEWPDIKVRLSKFLDDGQH